MESTVLRELLEEQLRLSQRQRARIRELEDRSRAPLAIVGMGLRFPGGVSTPEEYWELLTGDGEAVTGIPEDRPGLRAAYHPEVGTPGRSYVDRAGFLRDPAVFDADFFGISPREAETLDPQQRLLLETSWEALERAGIAVRREDRLDAGVFVGMMAAEYVDRLAAGPRERLDPYFGTGGGHCFGAGRISYTMGLRGPAVSVDTACSSSLVALHLAARSLRAGECRYALVGAANLLFSPQLMVSLCQSRALAPDGRCKPFTAAADGYGRGEGAATVVLMRLDDALREQRPVLAVVRGTAVNHDGAASGLTVPSGPAQQEVIRAALADAGVTPAEVSYVEAHGTGTSLGDPIEANALHAVFADRPAEAGRLLLGSVKARLGHLEAAAGMAGLIKLVLMLRHGEVPVDVRPADGELNPLIPWRDNRLEVPRRGRPWAGPGRLAGISAFGLSGTNAHAVVGAAPEVVPTDVPAEPRPELLVLSAASEQGLHALAARVSTQLVRTGPADLASVCHSLRAGRTPLGWRLAVTGSTAHELAHLVIDAGTTVTPPAGTPLRSVTVTTVPAADSRLAKAVAALAADLPGLAGDEVAPDLDPAAWLVRALRSVGLAVRMREAAGTDGPPAVLDVDNRRVPLLPARAEQATATFLAALAALWRAGADLRLGPLRPAGARFVADLPTYPFARKRFWIEEPTAGPPPATATDDPPPVAAGPVPADADEVARFLGVELAAVLKVPDGLDLGRSFAQLGGDSFTAMLFAGAVERRYPGVDIGEGFAVERPLSELLAELARDIAGRSVAVADGERDR